MFWLLRTELGLGSKLWLGLRLGLELELGLGFLRTTLIVRKFIKPNLQKQLIHKLTFVAIRLNYCFTQTNPNKILKQTN